MQAYIVRRVLLMAPTLFGVALLTFVLMRVLPGDVALLILAGDRGSADPRAVEALRHTLGLDRPIYTQFLEWLRGVVTLDFGTSFWTGQPVVKEILVRLPLSLEVAVLATIVGIFIAIPLGALAAAHQDSWIDYLVRVVTVAGLSIPSFWLGILMILFLVISFRWTPPLEFTPFLDNPVENLKQLIWPVLAVGYRYSAVTARMMRSSMLEVLREDYIRTARAKGLIEQIVLMRHALKNALLPVITIIGMEFAFLIGGLVVTEKVFNLNGIGRLVVEATFHRDFPLVQMLVLLISLSFVFVNLAIDLVYAYFDPRIKYR